MRLVQIRVIVTLIATFVAISFAILAYTFPKDSSLILTIEVILLPAIYVVGNYLAEYLIGVMHREELFKYQEDLDDLDNLVSSLNEKYLKLKYGKNKEV